MIKERKRMIFDVPKEHQIAIRLRAVKEGVSTSEALAKAIEVAFPKEFTEAKESFLELRKPSRRQKT